MRGLSKIKALILVAGTGASLVAIPLAPASAGTTNNPLTVAGNVRCNNGVAKSLEITGGGESHGAAVNSVGQFSVFFPNPTLPGNAAVVVRCDVGSTRNYKNTQFYLHRPLTGQILNVNLTA